MLFNSVAFLIFFPLVTAGFFALPGVRSRALFLLMASCAFYMAFVPVYILILLFTIVVDYAAGILIARSVHHRKALLMLSLIANVGVLAIFKYYPFIWDNAAAITKFVHVPIALPALKLVLPIGLSFHTFQAMSYTIEVYRGKQEPERNFWVYALYVMFYPQLVAGPIERPQNLLPQFRQHHRFDYDRVTSGLRRMAWGMFKKVVVADRLAAVVDLVYDHAREYHGLALITATGLFAFQIYLDFSAYSDIALGSAKVMGFTLMENFRTPYFSQTIGEFWRRWHISLSTWFKDYVYVPLGGSRTTPGRHYRNLLIVFMLSGLWHGANWTFVIWGALHGIYLICGTASTRFRSALWSRTIGADFPLKGMVGTLSTFALVSFAWIFFRARDTATALWVVENLFSGLGQDLRILVASHGRNFQVPGMIPRLALVAVVVTVEGLAPTWDRLEALVCRSPALVRHAVYLALIYATIFGSSAGSTQQFIYFQF